MKLVAARGWRTAVDRWWLVPLTVMMTALIRSPAVLTGRFWGEEASVFGRDLLGRSFLDASGYVYRGTLQLYTNWAVWLGVHAPSLWMPTITTWAGMSALFALGFLLERWGRALRVGRPEIAIAYAGFLLTPPVYEVAASATNLQWICSLICLLVLMLPKPSTASRAAMGAVLVLGSGLTGVCSAMLAPLFLLRGAIRRSLWHLAIGAMLSACALAQLWIIAHSVLDARLFSPAPLVDAAATGLQTAVLPLAGVKGAILLGRLALPGTHFSTPVLVLFVTLLASAMAAAISVARSGGVDRHSVFLIVCAFCMVTGLNLLGMLGSDPAVMLAPPIHGRYFVFGSFCLTLLVMAGTAARSRLYVLCARSLLAWVILVGVTQRALGTWHVTTTSGPDWRAQVAACRAARRAFCVVVTWPANGTNTITIPVTK